MFVVFKAFTTAEIPNVRQSAAYGCEVLKSCKET